MRRSPSSLSPAASRACAPSTAAFAASRTRPPSPMPAFARSPRSNLRSMRLPAFVAVLVLLSSFVVTSSTVTDYAAVSATDHHQNDLPDINQPSVRFESASNAVHHNINPTSRTSDVPILDAPQTEKVHDVSKLLPPNRRPNKKRILVTGGAGFIGSHLVDRLMDEGHMVIVADSLFTGKKSNLERHFSNPRFEFIRHDVIEPLYVEVDQIYHLACPASPIHYKYNPIHTLKTSFMGTYNMLGLAKRTHARFLITSTSEVYGDPLVHPQVEDYWGNVNPIGERSCYDEGKRVAETLCYDFKRQNGVDIRIARIFNTYGPRMALNDGRVVSNFVGQAIRGEELTVQGSGNQTRSFCYVSDQVDGLIRLMNTEDVEGPVNIGNPTEFTIRELADVVKGVVEPGVEITYTPLTPDDPKQRKPDIAKARNELGWSPGVELRDGLKLMAIDFRERIKSGDEGW
eukprot:TRINITY_DN63260_c0_g1_i1.p1 TRINITY_DN63260_c0_g1~~TRINITY_DN63260_c0_g1_i1.p1  ORF type:complete len:458 (-),score=76.84 TRINITY_DN63260_c0_g1_i1:1655-3028(-)